MQSLKFSLSRDQIYFCGEILKKNGVWAVERQLGFREPTTMPLQSKRSRQAKAQRASGKRGFDSGLTDDPFEAMLDPDYMPTISEDKEDSGGKLSPKDYVFSLVRGAAESEEAGDRSQNGINRIFG